MPCKEECSTTLGDGSLSVKRLPARLNVCRDESVVQVSRIFCLLRTGMKRQNRDKIVLSRPDAPAHNTWSAYVSKANKLQEQRDMLQQIELPTHPLSLPSEIHDSPAGTLLTSGCRIMNFTCSRFERLRCAATATHCCCWRFEARNH